MNTSFSLSRIIDVLKRKWITNQKTYLIFFAIFFFIDLFVCFIYASLNFDYGGGDVVYNKSISLSLDTLAIVILTGILPFSELTSRKNRMFELLYPASRLEKFIVELCFCFIAIPIAVLLVDMIAIFLGIELWKLFSPETHININFLTPTLIFSSLSELSLRTLLAISISFFGSILFRKYRLIKIWSLVSCVSFVFLIIVSIYVASKMSSDMDVFPYNTIIERVQDSNGDWVNKRIYYYNGERLNYVPWFLSRVFWNIATAVISLGFLVSSWFVYKKKTI